LTIAAATAITTTPSTSPTYQPVEAPITSGMRNLPFDFGPRGGRTPAAFLSPLVVDT
jgi:hypothetical protein